MNEPNLDRFSRPLWGERQERRPTWDELVAIKKTAIGSYPNAVHTTTKIQSQFNTELAKEEEQISPCCQADVYIQTVQDFIQQRTYDALTCWNCHQIIEEV
ncbi:hypothetical protein [Paenibacillus sp. MMO-58]|uniref:hypothetical protein n=1 Tax=Paenibacillus sp. MMO-58 TaxID=3081290 RepID=UPI00301771B3